MLVAPQIGGGVPSFVPFLYIAKGASFLPAFILSGRQFSAYRGKFSAKTGKSYILFGGRWCFLGILGDNKGRNPNIFLNIRKEGGVLRWSAAGLLACPLVAGGRGFRGSGPAGGWLWSSGGVFPAFWSLYCFAFVGLPLKYAFIRVLRAFLEGFVVRMYICMG